MSIPCNQLTSQPQQYTESYLPTVPVTAQVPDDLRQDAMYIIATLANEFTSNSRRNAARCFAYNYISRDGWNNADWASCITSAFILVKYFISAPTGRMTLDNAITAACSYVGRGVTGSLTSMYVEVQRNIDQNDLPQLLEWSRQYSNLLNQIRDYNSGSNSRNYTSRGRTADQIPEYQQSGYSVGRSTASGYSPPSFNGGRANSPVNFHMDVVSTHNVAEAVIAEPASVATAPVINPFPTPQPTVAQVSQNDVKHVTGEPMDRALHTILTVVALEADEIPAFQEKSKNIITQEGSLHPKLVFQEALSDFVQFSTVSISEKPETSVDDPDIIYRCMGYYLRRFNCSEPLADLSGVLDGVTTARALAVGLMSAANTVLDGDAKIQRRRLGWLQNIDNYWTDLINSYLTNTMEAGFTIDSFTSDYSEIAVEINRVFGDDSEKSIKTKGLWISFEQRLNSLIAERGARMKVWHEANDSVDDVDECVVYLPVPASVVHIPVFDKQLEYNARMGETMLIDPDATPALFNVAKSLASHCKTMEFSPMENYICTVDGRCYRFWANPVAGTYRIQRVDLH